MEGCFHGIYSSWVLGFGLGVVGGNVQTRGLLYDCSMKYIYLYIYIHVTAVAKNCLQILK